MFTGIIEELGKVKSFTHHSKGAVIQIECQKVLSDAKIGDSISINGCCQTIVRFDNCSFTADVSDETLNVTNFNKLKSGDNVNLERAITPSTRMGGHIVQGHIDCTGKFLKSEKLSDFYNLTFEIPYNKTKYIVQKGSIAINGVSLTVADIERNIVKIAVIPHTYANTVLNCLKPDDIVNIETDIIGKYIEKFLLVDNNINTINEEFLKENGFV